MSERDLSKEFDTLKEDLGTIKGDIGTLVESLKAITKSKATATRGSVEHELERALNEIRERGSSYMSAAEKDIVDRPLTSVLAAFGVGLLVGKLLDR